MAEDRSQKSTRSYRALKKKKQAQQYKSLSNISSTSSDTQSQLPAPAAVKTSSIRALSKYRQKRHLLAKHEEKLSNEQVDPTKITATLKETGGKEQDPKETLSVRARPVIDDKSWYEGLSVRVPREHDDKTWRELCDTMGYGKEFNRKLLEKHEFKCSFPPGKPEDIRVSKTMLILFVPEEMRGGHTLDLGDWITKVNGKRVKSRKQYLGMLRKLCSEKDNNNNSNNGIELNYQVFRTIKTLKIENPTECRDIPQACEINPGSEYFYAFLTLYPGSSLGISIKSYASKVYVSSTDNGFISLAMRTFLVGDAILQVDGQPVSSVKETSEKITSALKTKKYVRMVIERANSPAAIYRVKEALMAEKTVEVDPRMTDDVVEICTRQITQMTEHPDEKAGHAIIRNRDRNKSLSGKNLAFAEESAEATIGMDPINPILLQKAPPRPGLNNAIKRRPPRPAAKPPTKETPS